MSCEGDTLLHLAAARGNVALITHIVKVGGKGLLDIGDKVGKTPLHEAVMKGQVLATKTLLKLGANPNIYMRREDQALDDKSSDPDTPLMKALRIDISHQIAIMRLLLENGAQIHSDTSLTDCQEKLLQTARDAISAPRAFTFCWEQQCLANDLDDAASRNPQQLELDALSKDLVKRVCKLL